MDQNETMYVRYFKCRFMPLPNEAINNSGILISGLILRQLGNKCDASNTIVTSFCVIVFGLFWKKHWELKVMVITEYLEMC